MAATALTLDLRQLLEWSEKPHEEVISCRINNVNGQTPKGVLTVIEPVMPRARYPKYFPSVCLSVRPSERTSLFAFTSSRISVQTVNDERTQQNKIVKILVWDLDQWMNERMYGKTDGWIRVKKGWFSGSHISSITSVVSWPLVLPVVFIIAPVEDIWRIFRFLVWSIL